MKNQPRLNRRWTTIWWTLKQKFNVKKESYKDYNFRRSFNGQAALQFIYPGVEIGRSNMAHQGVQAGEEIVKRSSR